PFGFGAQRRQRAGSERKFRRHVRNGPDVAHQAVDEAARRTPGHQIGEHRAVVARRSERGPVRRRNLRLRTPEIGGADLHPAAPSAKAAAMPRASVMPPAAITGTLTASTTCGTSAKVPA